MNTTPLPDGVHKLEWTTKVKDLLDDDWVLANPIATENANVIDLLSHVTGVPGCVHSIKSFPATPSMALPFQDTTSHIVWVIDQ